MKKKFLSVLAIALTALLFAACTQPESDRPSASETGGNNEKITDTEQWTVCAVEKAAVLPEPIRKAFDTAYRQFAGSAVVPIAPLCSQVVAGMNYAILCAVTPVIPDAETALKIVIVYADLNGNATFRDFYDFDLAALKEKKNAAGDAVPLAGGWQAVQNTTAAVLPEPVQKAFASAVASLSDTHAIPLAFLGRNGNTEYAVLTANTPAGEKDGMNTVNVAFLSAPSGKKPTVRFATVDIADFSR